MAVADKTVQNLTAHIAGQDHAMAGATSALSAALACTLGEACVRISAMYLEEAADQARSGRTGERLAAIRAQLLALADEDSEVIASYAAEWDAGEQPQGQDRLCSLPVEMTNLAVEAAYALQDFRPLVRHVPDDLEMAIVLLGSAAKATSLVLDSNLHIWPEPELIGKYEPVLAELRQKLAAIKPVDRLR
jgi:formiminotetrahydrofolate cyclodeaminase